MYIHTMEYYLAIKNNENLPSAATWMDLKDIRLSKMSDKDKHGIISHISDLKNTTS